MPRSPSAFRQQDVVRALRAARTAGLEVFGYEIDSSGKIVVNTAMKAQPSPETEFDRWMATRARKTQGPQSRP